MSALTSSSDRTPIVTADHLESSHDPGQPPDRRDRSEVRRRPSATSSTPASNAAAAVCHPGDQQNQFGWLRWRPSRLQFLLDPRWFLAFVSIGIFGQSAVVNGLIGVTIATVERRFSLTSSMAAWIAASYEIAALPALLLVGYVGSSVRRPVWIAAGLAVFCVGSAVYALPHFVAPGYRIGGDSGAATGNLCWPGGSGTPPNGSSACWGVDGEGTADGGGGSGSGYLGLLVFAAVLMGFGSVPLHVLGVTFIDDSGPRGTTTFHLGIFYSMSVFGPVAAFICGGLLLKVNGEFDSVDRSAITLTVDDPRWVGAWWVGFLVSSVVVAALSAPFISGYPPTPSTAGANNVKKSYAADSGNPREQPFQQQQDTLDHRTCDDRDLSLDVRITDLDLREAGSRSLVASVKSLLTNGVFVCSALYGSADALLVNGFQAFGAKYLQQQFGLTASMAGIAFGVAAVPGGAGGFLVGSYLVKHLSPTRIQLLRSMTLIAVVTLSFVGMFAIQCDTAPLADIDGPTANGSDIGCSSECFCDGSWFEPVCADDGLTYFSPCYAGCRTGSVDNEFSNCTCASSGATANGSAVSGVCDVETCSTWKFAIFITLFFAAMFCIFSCGIFHLSVILRVVPHSQRPFAYAIDLLLQRLIGCVSGPILFGFVLDHSCLLWDRKCDGSTGSCLFYDNHQMAWSMLVLCGVCKSLNVVFGLVAWLVDLRGQLPGSPVARPSTTDVAYLRSSGTSAAAVEVDFDDEDGQCPDGAGTFGNLTFQGDDDAEEEEIDVTEMFHR